MGVAVGILLLSCIQAIRHILSTSGSIPGVSEKLKMSAWSRKYTPQPPPNAAAAEFYDGAGNPPKKYGASRQPPNNIQISARPPIKIIF